MTKWANLNFFKKRNQAGPTVEEMVEREAPVVATVVEKPKIRKFPKGLIMILFVIFCIVLFFGTWAKGHARRLEKEKKKSSEDTSKYSPEFAAEQRGQNLARINNQIKADIRAASDPTARVEQSPNSNYAVATATNGKKKPKSGASEPSGNVKSLESKTTLPPNPAGYSSPGAYVGQGGSPSQSTGSKSAVAPGAGGKTGATPTPISDSKPAEKQYDANGKELPPPPPLSGTAYNPKPITGTGVAQGSSSAALRGSNIMVFDESKGLAGGNSAGVNDISSAIKAAKKAMIQNGANPLSTVLEGD